MTKATKEEIAQLKKQKFVLTCVDKSNGLFPKIDTGLASEKKLTSSLDETYIFDGRDNPAIKIAYYNAIYKGIAEFEVFCLY